MDDHTPLKRCTQCGESKPATTEYFHRQAAKRDGLCPICKTCIKAQQARYREQNADLVRQRKREEYQRNKAKYAATGKRYREENRERIRERRRAWLAANRERVSARQRAYREANREAIAAGKRKWKAANREKVNQANREYRARNRDALAERARQKREAYPEKVKEASRRWYWKHRDKELVRRKQNRRANLQLYRNSGVRKAQARRARKAELPSSFSAEEWEKALAHFGGCCAACGRPPGLFHTLAMDHWIPLASPDCPGHIATNIVPLCHGDGGCNNSKGDKDPLAWAVKTFGKRKGKEIVSRVQAYFDGLTVR